MRAVIAAASLLAALGLTGTVAAQSSQGGLIQGVVLNATIAQPVAGAQVFLLFIGPQGPEAAGSARSNAAGRFAFEGLPDGRYLVRAEYRSIPYATHAVVGEGGRAELVVRVYETSERVALRIALLGMAVDAYPGYLRISEVVHLSNPVNLTFTGRVALPLPRGALYVTFVEGQHRPVVEGDALVDSLIVRPGGHQLAYAYTVGGTGEVSLERRWEVPIDRVEVLVSPPAEARSPHLRPGLGVAEGDRSYTRASGVAVPAGVLTMSVVGIPEARLWMAPAAAAMLAGLLAAGLLWTATREGRDQGATAMTSGCRR